MDAVSLKASAWIGSLLVNISSRKFNHLLFGAEAKGVEGDIGELQLLSVVDGVDLHFSLREAAIKCYGIRRPMLRMRSTHKK